MPSKPKLPLPNGYTRKFETEDVLVNKLVSRGLDVPDEDVLRKRFGRAPRPSSPSRPQGACAVTGVV